MVETSAPYNGHLRLAPQVSPLPGAHNQRCTARVPLERHRFYRRSILLKLDRALLVSVELQTPALWALAKLGVAPSSNRLVVI